MDVSNPSDPRLLGAIGAGGFVRDLFVSRGVAYLANSSTGLWCINITNPLAPALLGQYDTSNAYGVAVSFGVAFVADNTGGLVCINVSKPASPQLLGTCSMTAALGVCVRAGIAYVADDTSGLRCVDISNPANPQIIGTCDTTQAIGVTLHGNVALVADGTDGLRCINVSNPRNPYILGTCDTYYARSVDVDGAVAYVADDSLGIRCVNISNPSYPSILATYDTPGYAWDVDVSGGVAFVGDATMGLQCIEVARVSTPVPISAAGWGEWGFAVDVSGDIAYIINDQAYICVNISNPAKLEIIATGFLSTSSGHDIAVSGGIVYMATTGMMEIINLTNPASPDILDELYLPTFRGLCVREDVVYGVMGSGGFVCIDVSNLTNAQVLGTHNTGGSANNVFVDGHVAYIADSYNGLLCYNVSDPADPTFLDLWDVPFAIDVDVRGNIAYVADLNGGLRCVNVSNPKQIYQIGRYNGQAYDVCVDGTIAYVLDKVAGLLIINVSNPAAPTLLHTCPGFSTRSDAVGDYVGEVVVDGGFAYVLNDTIGLQSIQVSYHEWDRPLVVDNQYGDDTWRDSAGTTYDVDFRATLTNLSHAQYQIRSAADENGMIIKDWTNISTNINATAYTTDWPVDFNACQEGQNFVSVRVFDYAGAPQNITDAFVVRKDTEAPGIINNQPWIDAWQSRAGATYDVDLVDAGCMLNYAQYKICSAAAQGGTVLQNWTIFSTGINATVFTEDWGINFTACQEGINYVSVRAFDNLLHESVATDVFYVVKDTIAPTIHFDTPTGNTYASCPTITMTFTDTTSHLKHAYYKVDSPVPEGNNTQGWISLFADLDSATETTMFSLDQSVWAGLEDGTHFLCIKVVDHANNIKEGTVYAWQFTKHTEPSNPVTQDFVTGLLVGNITGGAIAAVSIVLVWMRRRSHSSSRTPSSGSRGPRGGRRR